MDSFLKKYCSPEWQSYIDIYKKQKQVKAKAYVFKEGETTEGLYIINKGKVKVVTKDDEGKETLIRLATDGDILGHRGFGGNWTYPISAIALENTALTFVPLNAFNVLAKSNAEFTYHLMMFFAEELRKSEEKMKQLPVKVRVARAIVMNYKCFGFDENEKNKLSFTLSRTDYASKAGTTYETVIRVLADLNKSGIIQIKGKSIYILDLEQLLAIAITKKG
ncbi:MAG: Crp/Fnr family transcriptional regulator [Vicingus serpentipes]|nr:Crp/Fnr family transcriptional regulator [Vicingus serpentipes]